MLIEILKNTNKINNNVDLGYINLEREENREDIKNILKGIDPNTLYDPSFLVNDYILELRNPVNNELFNIILEIIENNYNITKRVFYNLKASNKNIKSFKDIPIKYYDLVFTLHKLAFSVMRWFKHISFLDCESCFFTEDVEDLIRANDIDFNILDNIGELCNKYLKFAINSDLVGVDFYNYVFETENTTEAKNINLFAEALDDLEDYNPQE